MGIEHKINEIRQKPEHIRVRYVWSAVAISMLFVITLWFFSMKDMLSKSVAGDETQAITKVVDETKETAGDVSELKQAIDPKKNTQAESTANEIGR